MSDQLDVDELAPALLRTVVPGAWAAATGWLVTKGVIDVDQEAAVQGGLTLVTLGGIYWVGRKVERRLPRWATRILLGSARRPGPYTDPGQG